MDWITHAALGAAIGELILGKRLGKRALAWGALVGILPDLDVIVFPVLDTARQLTFHRGPSHSLLVAAIATYALARGLEKLWVKDKISRLLAAGFVFAVWSAHLLADCFSLEGAALLWPFSVNRIAFNHLFHFDIFFTAPLVISVLWIAILRDIKEKKTRGKKAPPLSKRRRICYWGLSLSTAYVLLSVGMKFIASAGFQADLSRRSVKFTRRMEAPTPYNILLWRAVVDREDEFWVGYRSVFELHESPVRWTIYPKVKDAISSVADLRETKALDQYTDGWWIARPHATGAWLGDMRFPEARTWGSKKTMVDSRVALSWVINPTIKGDHLRQISQDGEKSADTLHRLGARIFCDHQAWEANPRLAGVTGSLPEFLPVEE